MKGNLFLSVSLFFFYITDMNSDGIQENELFIFKRPTKPTTSKPVQLPSGTTTTASPPMTTTLAQLKKKGAVRRTFKIKQTFIKRFYPKRVFSPDYFKFIRRFRWEDFQRRKKNNRCPWC